VKALIALVVIGAFWSSPQSWPQAPGVSRDGISISQLPLPLSGSQSSLQSCCCRDQANKEAPPGQALMGCTDQGGKPICFLSGVVAVIRAVPAVRLASPRPALLGVGWGALTVLFPRHVPSDACSWRASPLNHKNSRWIVRKVPPVVSRPQMGAGEQTPPPSSGALAWLRVGPAKGRSGA
jgi:hypothetical protein